MTTTFSDNLPDAPNLPFPPLNRQVFAGRILSIAYKRSYSPKKPLFYVNSNVYTRKIPAFAGMTVLPMDFATPHPESRTNANSGKKRGVYFCPKCELYVKITVPDKPDNTGSRPPTSRSSPVPDTRQAGQHRFSTRKHNYYRVNQDFVAPNAYGGDIGDKPLIYCEIVAYFCCEPSFDR
jgi:hypothetical protein